LAERKNRVIVFLVIWNIVLTGALVFLGLMFIGKQARDERVAAALVHDVNVQLEAGKKWMDLLSGRIDKLLEVQQNLKTSFENLQKTDENPLEVFQQISQLETRFSDLTENLENLRGDINLVLRADKEHPVLAPNKGGRPRKEPVT
jgi:hypothetical protein